MDFSLSEEQRALIDLTKKIVAAHSDDKHLADVERSADGFHRGLYAALAEAGLLGIGFSEDVGGAGLGFVDLCLVLKEIGRGAVPVPIVHAVASAGTALDRFGSHEQKQRWLGGIASGEVVFTTGFIEEASDDISAPRVTATVDGGGCLVSGVKLCVPFAQVAARVVVSVKTGDGVRAMLIDPNGAGVSLERQTATNFEPQFTLTMESAPAEVLGGEGVVGFMADRTRVALAAVQVGVAKAALRMTAAYVSERKQFGVPLATFQAVSQRAADAYIDSEAMELTMIQAASRLDAGDSAEASARAVAIAKYWAALGGNRVTNAAQHLHGGMGFDCDYPLHRYTLWAKNIELYLGSASSELHRLGEMIAAEAAS